MSLKKMDKTDQVEKLYLQYELLSGKGVDPSVEENAYLEILSAVKGQTNEKKLACQFIPSFFDRFPKLEEKAIDAYLDLCEDSNITVRKEAIKKFPRFFNGQPNIYCEKFADILTQLLLVKDSSEASLVTTSLSAILKSDPANSLKGVFNQDLLKPTLSWLLMPVLSSFRFFESFILASQESVLYEDLIKHGEYEVRDIAIKYLASRIRKVNRDWNISVQDFLISEIKYALQEASPEDIPLFFGMLLSTHLGKDSSGRKQILNIFLNCIQLNKEILLVNDNQSLRKLISFIRNARVLFSSELHSDKYFLFFSREIIPKFLTFSGSKEGSGCCLALLKLFAEIAMYTKTFTDVDSSIHKIVTLLLEFLPCPSLDDKSDAYKHLQFTSVECLLSVLHQTLKCKPTFFSRNPEILKGLRYRFLYFAKATRAYTKVIENTMRKKTKEIERIKMLALRSMFNINVLIKDFFRNPPSQSVNIVLSWMSSDNSSLVRGSPDGNDRPEKIQKVDHEGRQPTYKPPIGKYSQYLKFNQN